MDAKRPGPDRGSAVPLRDLRSDARTLSVEDFEERHGSAFLQTQRATVLRRLVP